ncbi:MAG: DUF2282 domain-containing protein [Rickettsiaceae bacterium]
MNKTKLLATAFAAAAFSISSAYAADDKDNMEKCRALDSKGVNIIKEHKADCASKTSSCAGHNKAGDSDAWILVPKGDCDKINKGDFSDISKEIMDKLDVKNDE